MYLCTYYLYYKVYPTKPPSQASNAGLLSPTLNVEIQVVQQSIFFKFFYHDNIFGTFYSGYQPWVLKFQTP